MNEAIYQEAIKNGCTPRMAEMLASRKCPGLDTDKAFFNRFGSIGDELPTGYMEGVISDAKRNGYTPSHGDVYLPGLADERGDPKAFLSRGTGAKARIKEHLDRCKAGPDKDPLEGVGLRDNIVDEFVQQKVAEDPGLLERRKLQDVKEEIIAKHGPQK